MSKIRIKAVVFDLDGLMFNTEDIFKQSNHELVSRRGKRISPELRQQMMGRRAHEAFQIMIDDLGLTESVEEIMVEEEKLFTGMLDEQLAPLPGMLDLLDHLEEACIPKAVATSSGREYLHGILGRVGLLPRFHMTLAAEDVENGKPHPEIYETAAQRLEITTAEMMVLEDSEAGTKAAAAAGAITVSVPTQHSRTHDFTTATHIAESLADPLIYRLLSRDYS